MRPKRVVITGIGLITSIGIGKDDFWSCLINGSSGIKEITSFDTSDYDGKFDGEIPDFNPYVFFPKEKMDSLDKACQLALCSAKLAVEDSSLDLNNINHKKAGVIIGTTSGTSNSFEQYHTTWLNQGICAIDINTVSKYRHVNMPNCISEQFALNNCSMLIGTACAAGAYSIGESFDLIRYGKCQLMLAGGADAMSELSHCGFDALRSLTKTKCRPFDRQRDGLVVGEGSAVLILESLEQALARKANIYAEIIGYGLSCDAEHMTAPQVSGKEPALSMVRALTDAGIKPNEIDYINAHGTGTILNDKMETNAIKRAFGEYAYKVPISSIKSMIGHTFGAAGAIEAAVSALTITNNTIPPTINYQEPDPECDLDYVANKCRKTQVNMVLSSSFAFGGNNASLVLAKYKP